MIKDLKTYFIKDLGWGWNIQAEIYFNFVMRAVEASKGEVVLDVGAGYQRFKPFFSNSVYIAQEHPDSGEKNKGITIFDILCDAKCIPLESDSVDCVFSTGSVEHMEYPEQFFYEAFRVLRPGGYLFLNAPFCYKEHEIPYDFQRPTRYGIKRWYEHAKFTDIKVSPTSSSMYSATEFIEDAILEDLGGLRKALSANYLTGLRFAFEKSYFKKYFFYFFFYKPMAKFFRFFFDRVPDERTLLPIGWVAEGRKPGNTKTKNLGLSKAEFLERNILKNGEYVLQDGVIRPRL